MAEVEMTVVEVGNTEFLEGGPVVVLSGSASDVALFAQYLYRKVKITMPVNPAQEKEQEYGRSQGGQSDPGG